MNLQAFLEQLKNRPDSVEFDDTMAVIEQHYDFTPTAFVNGDSAIMPPAAIMVPAKFWLSVSSMH